MMESDSCLDTPSTVTSQHRRQQSQGLVPHGILVPILAYPRFPRAPAKLQPAVWVLLAEGLCVPEFDPAEHFHVHRASFCEC